ncbi:hypothetical protein ABZ746_23565 [Streptomyces sp. NPDC020096]
MYDPHEVLRALDAHRWAAIAVFGPAMALIAAWYTGAIRASRRHRTFSIPLACAAFYIAVDASFISRYSTWFGRFHHWFLELLWAYLLLTCTLGAYFIAQVMRYGHQETAAPLTPAQYRRGVLALVAGTCGLWACVRAQLQDPLGLFSLHLSIVPYPVFGLAMTLRRRSRRGQTLTMWVCYTAGITLWSLGSLLFFGPGARNWPWILLDSIAVLWALAATAIVHQAPDSVPCSGPGVGKRTNDDRRGGRPMNPDFSGPVRGSDPMRSDGG